MARKTTQKVSFLGLHWWVRPGKSPLWRKIIDGKTYTASGDGSGQPSEHSAEVAWQAIKAKLEANNPIAAANGPKTVVGHFKPLPRVAAVAVAPAFNLSKEIGRYLQWQEQRFNGGEITVHGLASYRNEVAQIQDFLARHEIEVLDEKTLADFRAYQVTEYTAGRQGLATLKRKLSAAKRLTEWLYENAVLATLPRNLKSVCIYNLPKAQRKKAKKAVAVYSIEQIKGIYKAASPDTRLYMLLALNCGMYYADIADLRHEQYANGRIARCRHKTGESGSWLLWATTRKLLEQLAVANGTYKAEDGEGSYMLRHKDGTPLYAYGMRFDAAKKRNVMIRCNHIETKFKDLVAALNISGDFRQLRATGATLVRNASDTDTAKLFLANSKETIAEQHYLAENFDGLDKALAEVENMLKLYE